MMPLVAPKRKPMAPLNRLAWTILVDKLRRTRARQVSIRRGPASLILTMRIAPFCAPPLCSLDVATGQNMDHPCRASHAARMWRPGRQRWISGWSIGGMAGGHAECSAERAFRGVWRGGQRRQKENKVCGEEKSLGIHPLSLSTVPFAPHD